MFRITYYMGGQEISRTGDWQTLQAGDLLWVEIFLVDGVSLWSGFDWWFLRGDGLFGAYYDRDDLAENPGLMLLLRPGLPAEFLGPLSGYPENGQPEEARTALKKKGALVKRADAARLNLTLHKFAD